MGSEGASELFAKAPSQERPAILGQVDNFLLGQETHIAHFPRDREQIDEGIDAQELADPVPLTAVDPDFLRPGGICYDDWRERALLERAGHKVIQGGSAAERTVSNYLTDYSVRAG